MLGRKGSTKALMITNSMMARTSCFVGVFTKRCRGSLNESSSAISTASPAASNNWPWNARPPKRKASMAVISEVAPTSPPRPLIR